MTDVSHPSAPNTRRRKTKALLAAGMVLGVGVATTLANWQDDEYATGTLMTAEFNLEGDIEVSNPESNDVNAAQVNSAYSSGSDPASPHTITVHGPQAGLMPGDRATAMIFVRLTSESAVDANLSITDFQASGEGVDEFSYDIRTRYTGVSQNGTVTQRNSACVLGSGAPAGDSARGTVYAQGATLSTPMPDDSSLPLAAGSTAAATGDPLRICLAFTATEELTAGQQTSFSFTLSATPQDDA